MNLVRGNRPVRSAKIMKLLLVGALAFVLYPHVVVAQNDAISVDFPNLQLPGKTYKSIEQVDFQNHYYEQLQDNDEKAFWIRMHRGHDEWRDPTGGGHLSDLRSVQYLNGKVPEKRFAMLRVDTLDAGGSSSPTGNIIVIDLNPQGHPVVRQWIAYNVRTDPEEVWDRYDPKEKILTVSGLNGWEHWGLTDVIVMRFRWNGEKFVEISRKKHPMMHPQNK
jgi:hypothetical protein